MSSILYDIDSTINNGFDAIKAHVEKFIKENYNGEFKISDKPNKDGLFEVDGLENIRVKNKRIVSLTNNLFVWNKVNGYFSCAECKSLKSLEGCPEEVEGSFSCAECKSLKSLKYAPEKVKNDFYCYNCESLKTLEGAPKEVNGSFSCSYCPSLESLKDAPEIVNGNFYCYGCKGKFTKNDVEKVSEVKMKIYC
jgi:hypothetical protein